MKAKSEVSIRQTWHPQFAEALEILQLFDSSPGSPNNAAALSLVFEVTKQTESQKRLGNWLVQYIEPFLLNTIRDEQNLQEKTLAIATYLFISARVELDRKLADEYLINYVEYASNQAWFEDYFLAFYCHYLKDQIIACEKIGDFFSQNYERALLKKHIPAISQSLIVLQGSITETESKRGYELLTSLLTESTSFSYIAWGLWALSTNEQVSEKLAAIIQKKMNDAFLSIKRESGIFKFLALAEMGWQPIQLQEHIDKQLEIKSHTSVEIKIEEETIKIDIRPLTDSSAKHEVLSTFDLCLALIGLGNSKHEKMAFLTGLDEKKLTEVSERIKRLSILGGIDLSRAEKNLLNILTILIVFFITALVFYLQIGGVFNIDFSNISLSNLSIEEILITVSLIDYLIGTIQAARTNGNAAAGLLKLPILRHWQNYESKRREKG